MIVRPWRLGDNQAIDMQSAQKYVADIGMLDVDLTPLSENGLAWSAEQDGKVLACWGIFPVWQGRAQAIALLGKDAGSHLTTIHRHALALLNRAPFRRIESYVDIGFGQGVRWMEMLGFELETYKRAFRPDGADMLEFVRIK